MKNDGIVEIDVQIKQLKSINPEVYSWVMLKEKQKILKAELCSDDPIINCDEKRIKLQEAEDEMKHMKDKYSSVRLYDALISVKQKTLEQPKDTCDQ